MGIRHPSLLGIVVVTVFEDIYQRNGWNGQESLSGPGSGSAATARVIPWIKRIVQEEVVLSILDIGCGDGFWMPDVTVQYTGIDISPTAVDHARARHGSKSSQYWRYIVGDASTIDLPRADMVIVRDVIQHLNWEDGKRLVDNVVRSGSFLLLASTFMGWENVPVIASGSEAYSPDLQHEPFNLPQPELLVFDGYYYHFHDTDQVRDPSKYLGLWRLR